MGAPRQRNGGAHGVAALHCDYHAPLILEVVRHAGYDDALFKKQGAFQESNEL